MYNNFKKLLKEKSLSCYKVSKETGISQATFSDWKNGRSIPKIDKLQKIADYLNIDIKYLISDNETESALPSSPDIPNEFVIMARKTEKLPEEQQKKIFELLNKTIDNVISIIDNEK